MLLLSLPFAFCDAHVREHTDWHAATEQASKSWVSLVNDTFSK